MKNVERVMAKIAADILDRVKQYEALQNDSPNIHIKFEDDDVSYPIQDAIDGAKNAAGAILSAAHQDSDIVVIPMDSNFDPATLHKLLDNVL